VVSKDQSLNCEAYRHSSSSNKKEGSLFGMTLEREPSKGRGGTLGRVEVTGQAFNPGPTGSLPCAATRRSARREDSACPHRRI
jgi:hypothetical protein